MFLDGYIYIGHHNTSYIFCVRILMLNLARHGTALLVRNSVLLFRMNRKILYTFSSGLLAYFYGSTGNRFWTIYHDDNIYKCAVFPNESVSATLYTGTAFCVIPSCFKYRVINFFVLIWPSKFEKFIYYLMCVQN